MNTVAETDLSLSLMIAAWKCNWSSIDFSRSSHCTAAAASSCLKYSLRLSLLRNCRRSHDISLFVLETNTKNVLHRHSCLCTVFFLHKNKSLHQRERDKTVSSVDTLLLVFERQTQIHFKHSTTFSCLYATTSFNATNLIYSWRTTEGNKQNRDHSRVSLPFSCRSESQALLTTVWIVSSVLLTKCWRKSSSQTIKQNTRVMMSAVMKSSPLID